MLSRRRQIITAIFAITSVTIFIYQIIKASNTDVPLDYSEVQSRIPLFTQYIDASRTHGGAWYIPASWKLDETPHNITHAARLTAKCANKHPQKYLTHSKIPRIIHQSWKSTRTMNFPVKTLRDVEGWLEYATDPDGPELAYFMWDDEGVADLVQESDRDLFEAVELLPHPVEKADIFRVLVCNEIGGVYSDIDTIPLRNPSAWVQPEDIRPWTDDRTLATFSSASANPVSLILGIEADTYEDSDTAWRAGYTYPVQLTQWTLAGAPKHPVMTKFLQEFQVTMRNCTRHAIGEKSSSSTDTRKALKTMDPLELTGPVAITTATKEYLDEQAGLRWQALSGLDDGGRSKLVLDVLVLPITGFSPGRGRFNNMGSGPLSHPDARVRHNAQGSWRSLDLTVELGKACRTILGMCRDWSKVPT